MYITSSTHYKLQPPHSLHKTTIFTTSHHLIYYRSYLLQLEQILLSVKCSIYFLNKITSIAITVTTIQFFYKYFNSLSLFLFFLITFLANFSTTIFSSLRFSLVLLYYTFLWFNSWMLLSHDRWTHHPSTKKKKKITPTFILQTKFNFSQINFKTHLYIQRTIPC